VSAAPKENGVLSIAAAAYLAAGVNDLAVADVHEVVVPLPCPNVVLLAPDVLLLLQHLANVLNQELPSSHVLLGIQAKALRARTALQQPPRVSYLSTISLHMQVCSNSEQMLATADATTRVHSRDDVCSFADACMQGHTELSSLLQGFAERLT
jgi:hypothetical protein